MSKYIFFLSLITLASCSGNKPVEVQEAKPEIVFEGNLIQPLYLGNLLESPNEFGPVWNISACKELNLEKISMYVKGGHLPNNMAEKLSYTFNAEGEPKDFVHYIYKISKSPYSSSNFIYKDNKLSTIDITKYLNFSNIPPVFIEHDSSKTISVTSRGDGQSDSLIFYPSMESPTMIVGIVNNFINSIEFFTAKETNTTDLKSMAMEIDSNLVAFELAEKTVTYMENGLPLESHHLDKSWNKQEKSRSWDYNSRNQPVKYKEWLHGTQIKDIVINYGKNNLPSDIIVDRKKYIFYTKVR